MKKNSIFIKILASCLLIIIVFMFNASAATIPSQGKTYNIRNSKFYKKNNVAPAINDMVSKMNSGDKLYLQPGNYKFKETINILNSKKRLDNCSIVLEGIYVMDGKFDAMIIDGDYLTVEIGVLSSGVKDADYKTSGKLSGGISLRETNYSDYTFDTISGFDYGIRFAPVKEGTGECYNKIRFKSLEFCNIGLNLHTQGKGQVKSPPWFNENAIFGGRIVKCNYGIYAKKGQNQIDEYNNNSYYNIAFSDIEKDAIFSEFSSFNSFYKPTFVNIKGFYINQKANSKANKFYLGGKTPIEKLALYAKGDIIYSDLADRNGNVVAEELTTTNLRSAPAVNKGFNLKNTKTISASSGTTSLPLNIATVNVSSSSSAVSLQTDEFAEYENYNFIVNVTKYKNPITIKNYTGANVIVNKINSNGKYKVIYMDDSWKLIKLS